MKEGGCLEQGTCAIILFLKIFTTEYEMSEMLFFLLLKKQNMYWFEEIYAYGFLYVRGF